MLEGRTHMIRETLWNNVGFLRHVVGIRGEVVAVTVAYLRLVWKHFPKDDQERTQLRSCLDHRIVNAAGWEILPVTYRPSALCATCDTVKAAPKLDTNLSDTEGNKTV